MAKPSHREKIIAEGLRLVHARGFAGASVRDIVQAAGVPQGSFTNHFPSKEIFALEVIERYVEGSRALMAETLADEAMPPLRRIAAFIEAARDQFNCEGMRYGCLLGNFVAESTELGEPIRRRLVEVFADAEQAFAVCLEAAVRAGDLPEGFDCAGTAAFIVSSLQGAILLAKAQRSPEPVDRLNRMLAEKILR